MSGFHEDERIRSKNAKHQQAYNMYLELSNKGLSDGDIKAHMQDALEFSLSDSEEELFKLVMLLAGGSREEADGDCDGGCTGCSSSNSCE